MNAVNAVNGQLLMRSVTSLLLLSAGVRAVRVRPAVMQMAAPPNPAAVASKLFSNEARELAKELSELAISQDPQVVFRRSLDLQRALNTVGLEQISSGKTPSPEAIPLVLRRICEELGATYIKLGQFVASSPTLFPPEYVSEFQKCLDSTPPMPWSVVKPLIEDDLGRPLSEVYRSVEQTPLAAASIAQVHAATLVTGEDVVIKVQKKGVERSLKADLDLLYATARVLELIGAGSSDLSDIFGTLREAILEETDFRLEAQRTTQFATFLQSVPEMAEVVTVPKVYPQASGGKVLTLERLYGVPLTDLERVRQVTDQPELALIAALNTWVVSVLTNEWFHADVHAGNLLVLNDGRVAFIDFGIVGTIPEATASAMLDFVKAFPAGDMGGVAAALSGMGFTEDDVDVESFARDLGEVFDSVESMDPDQVAAGVVDETQLNKLVAATAKVATNYGIRFPRAFALLVKQVLYFDRYTRILAPGLDVLSDERLTMNRPPPGSAAVVSESLPGDEQESLVVDVEVDIQ